MKNSKDNLKYLKALVYSMGITLIFGIIFISYTLYKQISLDKKGFSANTSAPLSSINIPETEDVISVSAYNNDLILLTQNLNGDKQIIMINKLNGKIQQKISLKQKNNLNNKQEDF